VSRASFSSASELNVFLAIGLEKEGEGFVRWFGWRSFGAGLGSCYLNFVLNPIVYMREKAEKRWLDRGVMILLAWG
jgi:hypothetical protein